MNKKKNPTRLLDFFSKKYYGVYEKMINELRPLLVNPEQSCWVIERLDFQPDLPYGKRQAIYWAIAQLLKPGRCVFAKGYCKNDLLRWLSDPVHSNLSRNPLSLQDAINKKIRLII
jgi:hypothetical protein